MSASGETESSKTDPDLHCFENIGRVSGNPRRTLRREGLLEKLADVACKSRELQSMTNRAEKPPLNTGPGRSANLCHIPRARKRKEKTQPVLLAPLEKRQLDLPLSLPTLRRVCVSLPPTLIQELDLTVKDRKLTRSFLVRAALEALLPQMKMIKDRESSK